MFLNELASRGLIQMIPIGGNPPMFKIVLATTSSQQQNQNNNNNSNNIKQPPPYQPPPYVSNNNNNTTTQETDIFASIVAPAYTSSAIATTSHEVPKKTASMFEGRSPLTFPPPMLVRDGKMQTRANPAFLVRAPPPFKIVF